MGLGEPVSLYRPPNMNVEFEMALANELSQIYKVVRRAYQSESVWDSSIENIKRRMKKRIEETLGKDGFYYIIDRDRNREIIAVTGVAKYHETNKNLLTGICVLPGYKKLGIGTNLLCYSLTTLKAFGMRTAQVFTKKFFGR